MAPDTGVPRTSSGPSFLVRLHAHAQRATTVADALLSVVFAPTCAACGMLLDRPTRSAVCNRCWASILPLTPPLCDVCGDPLPTWRTMGVVPVHCARCRRTRRQVDCARAIGAYEGALRAIVHALKYGGYRSLARQLAALMRDRAGDLLSGADVAVAVPLHPSRRRQRGFNQAADLARNLGLPVLCPLRRVRATAVQAGLPASRRHANVRGAFALTQASQTIRSATIVLVDDVTTTGATLEACARALKEGGAREVRAVTAARVVPPRR